MTERPLELEDELLGARLKSTFVPPPTRVSARLARLTTVGLSREVPVERATFPWREAAPRWIGVALMTGLVVGLVPRLLAWFTNPPSLDTQSRGIASLLAGSGALGSLMLPLGVLLGVEAMRGAPTVRRWLR